MSGEVAAVRGHPAVVASIVVAAVALTVCALVAIAYMVGWIPARGAAAPVSSAIPGQQLPANAPDVALVPGETLVAAPEKAAAPAPLAAPGPVTPRYGKKSDKLPAPAPSSAPLPAPAPAVTRAAPAPPAYARAAPPATSYERSARSLCINCGAVSSVRSVQGDWEVRVRFEDGSSETFRYPERQRFKPGDRVRLEDGRLVVD
jgi:hypothetical protein